MQAPNSPSSTSSESLGSSGGSNGLGLEKREEDLLTMSKQLEEAKKVAPAVFASPGDLFTWRGGGSSDDGVPNVVAYIGRNDIPPRQTKYEYEIVTTQIYHQVMVQNIG